MSGILSFRIGLTALCVCLVGCHTGEGDSLVTASGISAGSHAVTDPVGDAFRVAGASVAPDIASVETTVAGGSAAFAIRFKPGSFDRSRNIVTIAVDADRKPNSGKLWDGLGIDYFIYLGSDLYGANAAVVRLTSSTGRTQTASQPVTFFGDGLNVSIPLAALADFGPVTDFDYRVYASVLVPGLTAADIVDQAPNRVDAAPDTALPVAGTDKDSTNSTLTALTTTWTADQVREQVVAVDLQSPEFHPGYLVRWNTPIEVDTGGLARAEEALARYEKLTGGRIAFKRVTGTPANGVVYVEGRAVASDGQSPGCGNVADVPGGAGVRFKFDGSGAMYGVYYINLGSSACNDATKGDYDSAIAEHEMGHVLGVLAHFDGFTGGQGLMNPNYFNVVYTIYNNPIGATASQLNVSVAVIGQFGFY